MYRTEVLTDNERKGEINLNSRQKLYNETKIEVLSRHQMFNVMNS